jgi:hypothetical protein
MSYLLNMRSAIDRLIHKAKNNYLDI